jgi:hypothetical protein
VDTVVRQDVGFNNARNFNVNATTFVQDITQDTTVNSRTTTRKGEAAFSTTESFQYLLKLNLDFSVASDGSASQQTTASQEFKVDLREPFFCELGGQHGEQDRYVELRRFLRLHWQYRAEKRAELQFANSRGQAYNCTLQAENRALTSASEGCTEQIKRKR